MQTLVNQPLELVIVGDADAPQYAPALISGWNPRLVRMRGETPVSLRQALSSWASATGLSFREISR
ncbi:MAG: hypothetical protein IPL79_10900 [Myxococcales bacterium]|nr:hypothetical protein [Myxococcales bacterium]